MMEVHDHMGIFDKMNHEIMEKRLYILQLCMNCILEFRKLVIKTPIGKSGKIWKIKWSGHFLLSKKS